MIRSATRRPSDYDPYDLLISQIRDPFGNLVTAGERDAEGQVTHAWNDYRVLAATPGQRSEPEPGGGGVRRPRPGRRHRRDGQAGGAAGGQPGRVRPGPRDRRGRLRVSPTRSRPSHRLLGPATTRVLYDLDAYRRTRQPGSRARPGWPCSPGRRTTATSRRAADEDPAFLQPTRTASAATIQRKGQAAAGPVTGGGPDVEHRWIGTGWTVFNNKGKPVRTYEPFFTATPAFEFARAVGVSSVLFYDPVGRVVATLHPDDSYDKIAFDPWGRHTWDAGDTVLLDPRRTQTCVDYLGRYLATLSEQPGGWATWYQRRVGGALGRRSSVPPSRRHGMRARRLVAGSIRSARPSSLWPITACQV